MSGRLARLVSTFGGIRCPQIDDRGRVVPNSQSKYYLIDPLLAHLPNQLDPVFPVPAMTRLSEAALGIHVARAMDRLQPGRFLEGRALGYRRTGSGNEIDFAPQPVRTAGVDVFSTALESKWVERNWRSEALVVENAVGSGVLATKSVLDCENYPTWAIPAPIVALALSE
jgi:predicted AAA+ superfamily ATPase